MLRTALLLALVALPAQAASYFVRTNGSDGANGLSIANAWRTIGKSITVVVGGDDVDVGPGDFNEQNQFTGTRVWWHSQSNATTRQFRLDGASNTLSGIRFTKACDANWLSWNAFIYLDSAAHYTTVTNCFIGDQPWVSDTNFSFNPIGAGTNTISSPNIDFVAKGFAIGGIFWINGVSYSNGTRGAQYRFANQQRAVRPTNVTQTALTFSNAVLTAETNPSTWALISGGATFDYRGISFTPSGGSGPSNCFIAGNTFSNMVGQAIFLNGHDTVISNNTFVDIQGNSYIVHGGYNHVIISNYFPRMRLPALYSQTETVDHTGGTFYDYYVRIIIGSSLQTWNTNILIQGNWFEDIDNAGLGIQHVVVGDETDHHTYRVIGNVFVGVAGPTDGGQNNMMIESNTFYRCSFQSGYSSSPVTIGGELGIYTNNTLRFTGNLMVGCGDHSSHTNEGYPSFTATTGIISSNNYVCGGEVSRWNAMPSWPATNGVNGGDPMFVDEFNPRGPDGIPFTADDGLRLHPRSPARGMGALPAATATPSKPIAFFRPTNVASNYLDYTGTNFNPSWHTQLFAFNRVNWDRLYNYGDAMFNLPKTTDFNASNSISGSWSTNTAAGIRDYVWDFGDGSRPVWVRLVPDVTHTFLIPGQVTVTLWTTNTSGGTASHSRNYRVLPGTNFANDVFYVSTTGSDSTNGSLSFPWRTISNAVHNASPGDYIAVLPGHYGEFINMGDMSPSNGTSLAQITVVGYNAYFWCLSQRRNYWTWEGFSHTNTSTPVTGDFRAPYNLYGTPITNVVIRNGFFQNGATNISFLYSKQDAGIYNVGVYASNNFITRTIGPVFLVTGSNVVIDGNIAIEIAGEGDFISGNGVNYKVTRNYVRDIGWTNNNHSDFIQGAFGAGFNKDWLIERNWVELTRTNIEAQITSMGDSNYLHDAVYSNVVYRLNVAVNFALGLNPIGLDGPKIYNNGFYFCAHQTSHNIVHGGQGGGLRGIDVRNNVFYGCGQSGTDTGKGWYSNGTEAEGTNSTFAHANYNYVAGSNNVAKQVAPPHAANRWASTLAGVPQEVNGINGGDPGFVDAANNDWRPQANSILVGAGDTISDVTTDFLGFPMGTNRIIGPFLPEGSAATEIPPVSVSRGHGKRRGGPLP